jgi:hypothetical protein
MVRHMFGQVMEQPTLYGYVHFQSTPLWMGLEWDIWPEALRAAQLVGELQF